MSVGIAVAEGKAAGAAATPWRTWPRGKRGGGARPWTGTLADHQQKVPDQGTEPKVDAPPEPCYRRYLRRELAVGALQIGPRALFWFHRSCSLPLPAGGASPTPPEDGRVTLNNSWKRPGAERERPRRAMEAARGELIIGSTYGPEERGIRHVCPSCGGGMGENEELCGSCQYAADERIGRQEAAW